MARRYEKIGRVGEGTYGVVYKARDVRTNRTVALKRCLPHFETTDGFPVTTLREIDVLTSLRGHPNIVTLHEVAVSSSASRSGGVFLVFEYCDFDLARLVDRRYRRDRRSPFSEAQVKSLTCQLLEGLAFMHSRFVLHRDIKLSNLLYVNHGGGDRRRGQLRIADFGLSRRAATRCADDDDKDEDDDDQQKSRRQSLTPKVVSLWYRPPEILLRNNNNDRYTEAVDNWGAGCVVAELLEGTPLLAGSNVMDQARRLVGLLGPPPSGYCRDVDVDDHANNNPNDDGEQQQPPPPILPLLDRFGDDLSTAGLELLSRLLCYDEDARWTSARARRSDWLRGDIDPPAPCAHENMPVFSAEDD